MPRKTNDSIQLGPGCTIRKTAKRRSWLIRFTDPAKRPKRRELTLRTESHEEAIRRGRDLQQKWELGAFDPWRETARAVPISEALRRYQPHLSLATKGSYYRRLNLFSAWCVEAGLLEKNPCDQVEKPKRYQPSPKALTEHDLDRLLVAVEHHFETCKDIHHRMPNELWVRDAFDLMAATGLRPSELRRLRWGDVDKPTESPAGFLPGAIHVRSRGGTLTKSRRDRSVTLLPRAERRLEHLKLETRRSADPMEFVLKGPDGHSQISTGYLSRRFRFFREQARLDKHFSLYSLRHFFATEYLRRGGSLESLRQEMGHRELETTLKYIHIVDQERRRASYALFAQKAA